MLETYLFCWVVFWLGITNGWSLPWFLVCDGCPELEKEIKSDLHLVFIQDFLAESFSDLLVWLVCIIVRDNKRLVTPLVSILLHITVLGSWAPTALKIGHSE